MNIYRGDIKKVSVKNVEFYLGTAVVKTETVVVQKDALFYSGFAGRKISFDYDTFLPTEYEARDLVVDAAKKDPYNPSSCLFVDYNSLTPEPITKEGLKQLKKSYKGRRHK